MADVLNVLNDLMDNWIETELKMKTKDRADDRIEGLLWLGDRNRTEQKSKSDGWPARLGWQLHLWNDITTLHYTEQPLGTSSFIQQI